MDEMKLLISLMENPLHVRIEPITSEHRFQQNIFSPPVIRELERLNFIKKTYLNIRELPAFELKKLITMEDMKEKIEEAIHRAFPFLKISFSYEEREKK